jgi:cytochrome b pre-mRNA-processing protein 3
MLNWLSKRNRRDRNAHDFYGSIVAAARAPELYADYGVPDTIEGRFEMLVFHMYVSLDRLGQGSTEPKLLAQRLVDAFFADMDVTARQAGVGDMAVPRKMRKLATAYADRIQGYRTAFAGLDNTHVAQIFQANLFGDFPDAFKKANKFAEYARRLQTEVSGTELQTLMAEGLPTVHHG